MGTHFYHGVIGKKTFWLFIALFHQKDEWHRKANKEVRSRLLRTITEHASRHANFFLFASEPFTQFRLLAPVPKALQSLGNSETKTRNDAVVYLKGVLPLSTKLVSSISEYFEHYEALEYEEWFDMLSDIFDILKQNFFDLLEQW